MPKADDSQPKAGVAAVEKARAKTGRLTIKAVWMEVEELKQGVAALDAKATGLAQLVEGVGSKIEASRPTASNTQGAQQLATLSSGVHSLNGNYLRQVDELASIRRSINEMGSKVENLTAGTKLVEESCGAISIEVDGLKENIDKASKKIEAMEAALVTLEGSLKRGYWMTGLVVGALVVVVVVAAILFL